MTPRSARNNNPLNIETGDSWAGLLPRSEMTQAQADEPRFCVFKDADWGFRAACKVLKTYYYSHGCNTPHKIIARFAPPIENDSKSYEQAVAAALGIAADDTFQMSNMNLFKIVKAMAIHETGSWEPWWNDGQLTTGMTMA